MTRAEEAAMEAYPPKFVSPKRGAKRIQSEKVDTHAPTRAIYRKGYEQAEEDTIKRAENWIKENVIWNTKFIERFRKAMEDESHE